MKVYFVIFSLIISCLLKISLSSEVTSPGMILAVSQAGIDSLESEFFPTFFTGEKIKLDDMFLKQHIDFLGTIRLNITDSELVINGFTGDNVKIIFNEPNTVQVYLKNLTGNINFNYSFKSGFYDNSSPGFVNVSNISIEIKTDLLSQPNFYEPSKLSLKVNITDLQTDIGGVDVNFKNLGNLEKLIKYFIDNVQEAFIKLIKEKLSLSSGELNRIMNDKLSQIKLEMQVPQTNLTVDYTLASDPKVLNKNLEISMNTTFTDKNLNDTFSGQPYPIPHLPKNSTELLTAYINQNLFDSVVFILFKENKTNYFVNSQNISTLTTLTLGLVIPELYQHYNESKKVDINLTAEKMPQLSFLENLTLVELDYLSDFIVHVNDTQVETAFTADLNMKINLTLLMIDGALKAKINEIKINKFNVTNSNIGPINDKDLPDKLNVFLNGFLQVISNKIDEILSKIKIPEYKGINFNHSEMSMHPGYLELSTTPHLHKNQNNTFNLFFKDEINFLIDRVKEYQAKNKNLKFLN